MVPGAFRRRKASLAHLGKPRELHNTEQLEKEIPMRKALFAVALAAFILHTFARAEDKADNSRAIVDKAIKALGGADKIEKFQGSKVKTKGNLELKGGIPFTQDLITRLPDQYRESLNMDVSGKNVSIITVFDGKTGWMSVNGETKEAEGKILEAMKEASYMLRVGRLIIKDKNVKLAPLGEAKVDGKPVIGVRVSSEGHRDVNLYFDKETGLPAKVEQRVHDFQTSQDVNEERIIKGYMEVDGIKTPKKVVVNRDGKKFMEIEVQQVKMLESVDKGEFEKP
jgi:hypothetical protein